MKRILMAMVLTLAVAGLCFGGSMTGYVTDMKCAKAGKSGPEHAGCAKGCLKDEAMAAVLVTEDGKIYEVADEGKKIRMHAGMKVTVMGMVDGMKITSVDSVKMAE